MKYNIEEMSMNEKITSIEEVRGKQFDYERYNGYIVKTDKQEIFFGISKNKQCCESFGYFTTPDETAEFIGADLLEVKVVDTALDVNRFELFYDENRYNNVMFVNLETSNGLLQFIAYNKHNGYYGHDAIVTSDQLTVGKYL